MRSKFDMQLELLNNSLISMGAMCENAIACAVKAMVSSERELAKKATLVERDIDHKEKEIEGLCLKLLLQQQPVAKDLRLISSALKMITDMERIGDQAADIAEIVRYCRLGEDAVTVHIKKMAEATIKMVTQSVDAFVKKDLVLANEVVAYDDVVDDLFLEGKGDIIEMITESSRSSDGADDEKSRINSEAAVDMLMIAKYLERIGDHATNIAEWVAFSITGTHDEAEQ